MTGEYTFYGDASDTGTLEAVSNCNPYSEEYKAVAVSKHLVERMGAEETILCVYSNHSNERRAMLPDYYPDATIFSVDRFGEVTVTYVHYHGWHHVKHDGLHFEQCRFRTEENDMRKSGVYLETLRADELNKKRCEWVFGRHYHQRFMVYTQCVFHTPCTMPGNLAFANMGEAYEHLRVSRPEMALGADHRPRISVEELMLGTSDENAGRLCGFVCFK